MNSEFTSTEGSEGSVPEASNTSTRNEITIAKKLETFHVNPTTEVERRAWTNDQGCRILYWTLKASFIDLDREDSTLCTYTFLVGIFVATPVLSGDQSEKELLTTYTETSAFIPTDDPYVVIQGEPTNAARELKNTILRDVNGGEDLATACTKQFEASNDQRAPYKKNLWEFCKTKYRVDAATGEIQQQEATNDEDEHSDAASIGSLAEEENVNGVSSSASSVDSSSTRSRSSSNASRGSASVSSRTVVEVTTTDVPMDASFTVVSQIVPQAEESIPQPSTTTPSTLET